MVRENIGKNSVRQFRSTNEGGGNANAEDCPRTSTLKKGRRGKKKKKEG